MAIDKEEIEKYIFDPENPRACKSYKLLFNIARKNAKVYIDFHFVRQAYEKVILTSEFDNQIWDKDDNYNTLETSKKIDIFIKSNSQKEFIKYVDKLNISNRNFIYNKIFTNFFDYTSFDYISILRFYSTSLLRTKISSDTTNFTGYRQYKDSFTFNKSYQGHKIIFTNENNILEKSNYFYDVSNILLTSNKDLLNTLNNNIKYIFLKKIEDVDILLNMLEHDLKQEKLIEQYSAPIPYLDAIKIQKYFSIEDMVITDLKEKKEIYFVGENGDGKTILLQAIILALKKEYAGDVIEHNRNHQGKIQISIKDEFATSYREDINILNVFAYGINRNKIDSKLFDTYGYSGIFDTSDPRKTTYLKDPFHELGQTYQGDDIFIIDFIEKLNTVILKENYQLFNGGDMNFNELSEGYKSTVIWIYDLLSRLIENQKDREEVKEIKDFRAIVLIDEVDLYLHPKWKYDFVENLRAVFPNIQFIMITHSIETILGAGEKAVFYKVYKEEGVTKVYKPMDTIKNLMANALVTSPLFDMDTARARNNDNKLDTREDFISSKIHTIMKNRLKGKKAIVEDDIMDMINQELDDYLKANDL